MILLRDFYRHFQKYDTRWFVVRDGFIAYFKTQKVSCSRLSDVTPLTKNVQDTEPLNVLPLTFGTTVKPLKEKGKRVILLLS